MWHFLIAFACRICLSHSVVACGRPGVHWVSCVFLLTASRDAESKDDLVCSPGCRIRSLHSWCAFYRGRVVCQWVLQIIPLGWCNERAVFLLISGAATNEEWQRRNHCCGAMLLFVVFLSIYGSKTNMMRFAPRRWRGVCKWVLQSFLWSVLSSLFLWHSIVAFDDGIWLCQWLCKRVI